MYAVASWLPLGLILVAIYQSIRLQMWVMPIDRDHDTVFASWPGLLLVAGLIMGLPNPFMSSWHPQHLGMGGLLAAAAFFAHMFLNVTPLRRAAKYHGRYRLLWF